jgi:Ca-activated chloride channel family protein
LTVPRAGETPAPVPLEGVRIEARIRDFCTRVTVSQRYRNTEDAPLEAVYVFPLDEGAAVCGFEALIDGAHVVGRVKEREEAFAAYDDAMALGHGAYLLDQERPDVFTASIGNLPPGKEAVVRITYVAELARDGDDLRFALPTTVSPRYAPESDRRGVGRTPAEALNPPVAWHVPYGLDLEVALDMPCAIRAVESPSHLLALELDGRRATVRLGERATSLDRDFVLKVRLAQAHAPRACVETDGSGRTAAVLAFEPRIEAREVTGEVVFLVDRSGSMQGTSIAEARNALQLCLRSLRPGNLFNIVGFGNTHESLFSDSRAYDEQTLAEASRHVTAMEADLGGTEILPALASILERPALEGRPRQLFVLTDGQVTNTGAVIALVRKHSVTTRLFAFGIGAGASAHLVRGIARAGEGEAEFIHPGERVEEKVLRQLKRALSPALTDLEIDWGGLAVRQAPHRLPPVFSDGRVLVYGFLDAPKPADVTLRAKGPDGPVAVTLRLDPGEAASETIVSTIAARTMIRDLEEGRSALHDRRGSLQEERTGGDRVKKEIVRLGVEYGLVSSATSFVAVEERETPVKDRAVLRRVPVALTRGWGGTDRMAGGVPPAPMAAAMVRDAGHEVLADLGMSRVVSERVSALGSSGTASLGHGLASGARAFGQVAKDAAGIFRKRPRSAKPAPPSTRRLDRLVALQRADGSWDLTEELAAVLGRPLADLEVALAGASGEPREARRAWATALALAWLDTRPEAKVEWELLAEKAEEWLARAPQACRPRGGGSWLSFARSYKIA